MNLFLFLIKQQPERIIMLDTLKLEFEPHQQREV